MGEPRKKSLSGAQRYWLSLTPVQIKNDVHVCHPDSAKSLLRDSSGSDHRSRSRTEMASLSKTISAIEWKELGEAPEFGTSRCEDEAGFGTSTGADAEDDGSGDALV
jgi:hypothetical protein